MREAFIYINIHISDMNLHITNLNITSLDNVSSINVSDKNPKNIVTVYYFSLILQKRDVFVRFNKL